MSPSLDSILSLVIKMETIIYLIRHSEQLRLEAQAVCKETSKISQKKNEQNPLSNNGEILAQELSDVAELKNIDVRYSSNYVRAISTAKYIAEKNDIKTNIDERLRRT